MKLSKRKVTITAGIVALLILLISIPLGNGEFKSKRPKDNLETLEESKNVEGKKEVFEENTNIPGIASEQKGSKDLKDKNNQRDQIDENEEETQSMPDGPPLEIPEFEDEIHFVPSKNEKPSEKNPEKQYPQIAGGKLVCDSFGRYTGQYVEDGRDELVDSVAAILVTNKSDEYLDYATLTFDVDGKAANFIVTGLPAGTSAWVLDANKLVIESGADFTYQDCASDFRNDVDAKSDKVGLSSDGNMLTATNNTNETLEDVVVYYRVMHTDGNYLGGITYTANFDTLEPGQSTEVLAGHYSSADSEVVRVSWSD